MKTPTAVKAALDRDLSRLTGRCYERRGMVFKKLVSVIAAVVVVGIVAISSLAIRTQANVPAETNRHSFFDYSAATDNIEPVGEPIPVTPRLLEHGKWVFRGLCIGCHGVDGDGNGAAWELWDEYAPEHKLPRKPRDSSDARQFVGVSDPKGVYQTFNTGFDGTPMPSFLDFLDEEQSWQLVWYVISHRPDWDLQATRKEMMRACGKTIALADDDKLERLEVSEMDLGDTETETTAQ